MTAYNAKFERFVGVEVGVRPAEDLFSFPLDFIRFRAIEYGTQNF